MVKKAFRVTYQSNTTGRRISTDLIVEAESLDEAQDKLVKASLDKEVEYEIRKVDVEPSVYPMEIKFPSGWCKIVFLAARVVK